MMFPPENKSLLNEKIFAFYKVKHDNRTENVAKYFEENCVFNGNLIIERLAAGLDDLYQDILTFKYEDYLKCFDKLLPIFKYAKVMHNSLSRHTSLKLHWIGVNIKPYFEICHASATMEQVLIITALLENALANVFYTETNGRQAPHLLRDLISTKEIQKIFGLDMVILLKILMGTPNSINIRNVVWHGFPKPEEIPDIYVSVLLLLMHTLGSKIEALNYVTKQRPLVINFDEQLESIENEFKTEILDMQLKYYEQQIKDIDNDFAKDYVPYWLQIFSYYQKKNYIEFVILVVPQIELLLRLHYGRINNVDINAKLDEYYITMDTIFETHVTIDEKEERSLTKFNRLLDFVAYPCYEGCFHLIYDLFLSPHGCRLRDKVSHGEVRLDGLNNPQLAALVLNIFLNLLQPLKCYTLKNYQSIFHLNCVTKQLLLECNKKLQTFNDDFLESTVEIPGIPTKFLDNKVFIFKRAKKESEFMLLIKKVIENIKQTVINYEESISIRLTLKSQGELHSKRRRTLEKLQSSLPEICNTLILVWCCSYKLYSLLQSGHINLFDDSRNHKTVRFLKHTLSISENLLKYSHSESNEWIKSLELCCKFKDFYDKLFLYKD